MRDTTTYAASRTPSTPEAATTAPAPSAGSVQLKSALRGKDLATQVQLLGVPQDPQQVQAVAADGIKGGGGALPHGARIQQAFGGYDISNVHAHTGPDAQAASAAMGAEAYATGNDIAFGGTPDLHTAAHEAAHVVQQRAGVSLSGDVGAAGDPYEVHADRVADAVVQGQSAEPLLAEMAGPASAGAHTGVQRMLVQMKSPAQEVTDLLSYGIVDWAITDAEALQAFNILAALDLVQLRTELGAIDPKMLTRLLDNLPAVARQDPAYTRIVCAMGPRGVRRYVTNLLSYGIFDWAVSPAEVAAVLEILLALGEADQVALFDSVGKECRERLTSNLTAASACDAGKHALARRLFDATQDAEVETAGALLGWRFNLHVDALPKGEGGIPWSKTGLERCWDVFDALPPEHVSENANFNELLRYDAKSTEGWANDAHGINAMGYSDGTDIDTETESGAFADPGDPMYGQNIFDATVRHEVGHLVDQNSGGDAYCATNGGGAWEYHGSGAGLAEVMVEAANGPIAAVADADERDLYVSVLQNAIDTGSPASIESQLFTTVMAGRDYTTMAPADIKHAVETIEALQSDDAVQALMVAFEKDQPWDTATGGIPLGERIYQEGYAGEWNSYAARARTRKVSRYQFRTAAEWFAEAYAAYYQPPGPKGTFLAAVDPATKAWFDVHVDPKGGVGSTEKAAEPKPEGEG